MITMLWKRPGTGLIKVCNYAALESRAMNHSQCMHDDHYD